MTPPSLEEISTRDIDKNLVSDLNGSLDGWDAYEAVVSPEQSPDDLWHVVFNQGIKCGGAVYIGLGSSGQTFWTNAASPEDTIDRVLEGDLEG